MDRKHFVSNRETPSPEELADFLEKVAGYIRESDAVSCFLVPCYSSSGQFDLES